MAQNGRSVRPSNPDPSRHSTNNHQPNSGIGLCIGGPALVEYLRPSDKELFNRFSPDIQQRSMEEGPRRAQEFDEYVGRLKEWSKSDKSSMFVPDTEDGVFFWIWIWIWEGWEC